MAAIERLRKRAAQLPPSQQAAGFDDVITQALSCCDWLSQELARQRLEFDTVAARLKGEAARSDDAYALLFDSVPVACIQTDAKGIIIRANRSAALLLNMSARNLDGRMLRLFSEHRDEFDSVIRTLAEGATRYRRSLAIRPRERAPFRVELMSIRNAADADGGWLWFFGTSEQLTGYSLPPRRP